jgi:peptide/nickel transport system substrate-binding protein
MSRGNDIGVDRRKLMQILGAGGSAALIAGCSTGEDTPTPTSGDESTPTPTDTPTATPTPEPQTEGGTYIAGTTSTANAASILSISDAPTGNKVDQMFDGGFIRKSPEYEDISPRWFESYEVTDSLDAVDIKLRENLEFSDPYGQLDAETYMWNIENLFRAGWYNYDYKAEFYYGKEDTPLQFEKTGTYSLRVSVDNPRPFFPYNVPLSYTIPAPRDIVEPYMEEEDGKGLEQDDEIRLAQFNGNLGPWTLEEYNPQSVYDFVPNESYYLREHAEDDERLDDRWARAPFFEGYQIQYFQEPSSARQALKAGEIDQTGIPATKLSNFTDVENLDIYTDPYDAFTGWLGLNHRQNGWSQLEKTGVRQAFSYLYDNDFIMENIQNGRGAVQDTLHPQWGPYYPDEDELWKDDGSLETAKTMLEEETDSEFGYSGDQFVDGNGDQVELECVYRSSTTNDLSVEYLKKRFENAGFSIKLTSTTWTQLTGSYLAASQPVEGVDAEEVGYGEDNNQPSGYNLGPKDEAVSAKSWDMMVGLGAGYGPLTPAGTITVFFGEEGFLNGFGYEPSKDLETLRDQAQTAETVDAARETITEMLATMSEDRPVVWTGAGFDYFGFNARIEGKPENPATSYYTNLTKDLMAFEDGESGR